MAVVGPRSRQLVQTSEKRHFKVRNASLKFKTERHKAAKEIAGGRKSWKPHHLQPKPSHVQSVVESAHQESASALTNGHARADPKPSQILVCENAIIFT